MLGLGLLAFAACDNDDPDPATAELTLNINNVAMLESDEKYEGWIVVDGTPVSTGLFTVNAAGDLSQSTFTVDDEMLNAATAFVLSIEPSPDPDPAPNAIKLFGGNFSGSNASISTAHPAALGVDLGTATGTYILATPTTAETTDELSGLWFLSTDGPSAGLSLPALPSNWVYEGWAVIDPIIWIIA